MTFRTLLTRQRARRRVVAVVASLATGDALFGKQGPAAAIRILSRAAVGSIEPRLIEVSRALRLSPADRVRKIIIPAALPRIFLAFRLAAGIALIVAVTVEIAINPIGLGAAIMTAQQALRPDLMLAYLVWIGTVGYLLNSGLVVVQRHLFGRAALVREAT